MSRATSRRFPLAYLQLFRAVRVRHEPKEAITELWVLENHAESLIRYAGCRNWSLINQRLHVRTKICF